MQLLVASRRDVGRSMYRCMGEGGTEGAPGQYYSMPPHKHYTRNWKIENKIDVKIDIFNIEIGLIKTNGFVFML